MGGIDGRGVGARRPNALAPPCPPRPHQVSNTPFTEQEFDSWQRACRDAKRRQVSRRDVADTRERLLKAAK